MKQTRNPSTITFINTTAFALSFAAWVMLAPSVRQISAELHIAPAAAAFLKAVPILVGSIMRIPVGILTDRLGARLMFPSMMLLAACGVLGVSFASSWAELVGAGLVLGFIGTTFVVGVQSVSTWTDAKKQGAALGIFGAGNVGTALTTFGMPLLLAAMGWRWSFRVYALVLVCYAALYAIVVRNQARKGPKPTMLGLVAFMKSPRALRFGLYYMATFGGFVATTLCIGDLYIDAYHLSAKTAGILATTFTFSASLSRIPGGSLSDKYGARRVLRAALVVVTAGLGLVVLAPPLPAAVTLVFVAGAAMGVGSAAVFKYIPQFFPASVGAVGGFVGCVGGIGGFVLPLVASWVRTHTGSAALGFLPLACLALASVVVQSLAITLGRSEAPDAANVAPITPSRTSVPPSKRAA